MKKSNMSSKQDEITVLETFKKIGFVLLPSFLDTQEMADLKNNMIRYIREIVPSMPKEEVYYDDRKRPDTLKQISNMFKYDEFFHGLMFGSRFEAIAELLLNGPVSGKNLLYFNKAPGTNLPTPPHQDGYFFMIDPCEAVSMWLALEKVDTENGCVRYIPGSHKEGMRPHGPSGILGFSQHIIDYSVDTDVAREVAMPAEPGDLLVHHCLTIHTAGANKSQDRTREALSLMYYSQQAREDLIAKAAYQKKLDEELAKSSKI